MLLHFRHDTSQDTPPTFWAIRTPRYKYIETPDTGEVELYDLNSDPYEVQSVAGQAGIRTGAGEPARAAPRAPERVPARLHRARDVDQRWPVRADERRVRRRSHSAPTRPARPSSAWSLPPSQWKNCTSPTTLSGLADGTTRSRCGPSIPPGTPRHPGVPRLHARYAGARNPAHEAATTAHARSDADAAVHRGRRTRPRPLRVRGRRPPVQAVQVAQHRASAALLRRHVFRCARSTRRATPITTPARAVFKVRRRS